MRNKADRIRHAVGFEILGLLVCTPLTNWLFGVSMAHTGLMIVILAFVAMGWNYLYNAMIDRLMLRYLRRLEKTVCERVAHAILFEVGLTVVTLPMIAWWMGLPLVPALVMDVGVAVFYMAFAFFYNLAYDRLFPAGMVTVGTAD